MNKDDQELFNEAKKALNVGSLEEVAVVLGYAKTSANNWYGKGFSDRARYKLIEILEEHRENNRLSELTQEDIEKYYAIASTKQAVSEMQQNQKPMTSDEMDEAEKLLKLSGWKKSIVDEMNKSLSNALSEQVMSTSTSPQMNSLVQMFSTLLPEDQKRIYGEIKNLSDSRKTDFSFLDDDIDKAF